MVLHSVSEGETPRTSELMASTAPAKSQTQPLHNFSLPCLKWSTNNTTNPHRGRRLSDSSLPPPLPPTTATTTSHFPTPLNSASETELGYASFELENRKNSVSEPEPEPVNNARSLSPPDQKSKKSTASDVDVAGEVRSKIFIRIRTKNNKPDDGEAELDESGPKTWNLRPRRVVRKRSSGMQEIKPQLPRPATPNRPESTRSRTISEAKTAVKKEKFSFSLSRNEIEEDIFMLTGSKPARRPKKRAKNVQKQLDSLVPGLWLAAITPDSYRVSDTPTKG